MFPPQETLYFVELLIILLYISLLHILFRKLHTFVLVYFFMPFSPTRVQAPHGLGPLCLVHLGPWCLVFTGSAIDVSSTCSFLAVILLPEVWCNRFLND